MFTRNIFLAFKARKASRSYAFFRPLSLSLAVGRRRRTFEGLHCFLKGAMSHSGTGPTSGFRLPGDIIPLHYDLDIVTHLEDTFCFEGEAKIKIQCLKSTDAIIINARDLTFQEEKVKVTSVGEVSKSLMVNGTSIDTVNEFYIIKTEMLKAQQEYLLHLSFEAPLTEDLIGYYYSSYSEKSSMNPKYLAVTHFEPSDARQAFPCFDEPGLKATFSIRLGHSQKFKSVSNMPLKSISPFIGKPSYVWSEFEQTVPMSTYLVAYMVSEFEFVASEPLPNNITFRVWARPDALGQTAFPALVGPKFLSFYEDFFGVKYPLPKQDLLAIPDFKIGAMENWGIITFRESSLLVDEETTSSTTRLHVATIIAHELGHMWFGNLVTMFWWTDLWLKEGFATYMAGVAVHHEFPEWNSLDAGALSDLLRVFHLDSLKSSHPVSVPIGHSKEINQIFDAISYDKGSFLLRMMSLFLGEEVFRHGVSEYLKKHKFSNAEQDDLWASLTEQAHRYSVLAPEVTVKQIMDTWTLQTGYPIITVTRDYGEKKATVTQKRFLATKSENESDYEGSWWVPLSYSTEKEPHFNRTQPEYWLPKDQESMVLDVKAGDLEWMIFNNRAAGLYKVNYDPKNWELLSVTLQSEHYKTIDVMNRALLIIDSMDLANSGIIDYGVALMLISYIEGETEFVPWNAALTKLEPIKAKLCRTPQFGTFKKFMRSLLERIVDSLGAMHEKPDSFEKGRLINLIAQWALPLRVGQFNAQAIDAFNLWFMTDNADEDNPVPKDFRRAVYAHAVEFGGEDIWNFLWRRYKMANVAAEKNNILMALTNSRDVWVINRYLEMTLNNALGIRKQDAFLIFKATASKEIGFYVAQKFFIKNIERISEYFGANSDIIGHYFSAIAEQMIYQHEYDELHAFAEKYKDLLAPASLTVKQALETVEVNIRWMDMHYETIGDTMKFIISI